MAKRRWQAPVLVFCIVTAMSFWLIAVAGTDLPKDDQWDAEGFLLYPLWQDHSLSWRDLVRPHNEHRIFWTRALDLMLFITNGQWDPLVQLYIGALLRGAVAAVILGVYASRSRGAVIGWMTLATSILYDPITAWNNVLWGFQSQIFFSALFSVLAIYAFVGRGLNFKRVTVGLLLGLCAQFAMSAGAFVPIALIAVASLRIFERRRQSSDVVWLIVAAIVLAMVAVVLHVSVPGHTVLEAKSVANWSVIFSEIMAWPHVTIAAAGLILNLPLIFVGVTRLVARREAQTEEDFSIAIAAWATAAAAAAAWFRGGGGEFVYGVPSRYIDFLLLLPIANVWCLLKIVEGAPGALKRVVYGAASAWGMFLFIGWAGGVADSLEHEVLPRIRHRDEPLILTREFQRTNDPNLFRAGEAHMLPHPSPASVKRVLNDPRMKAVLPPSLQPTTPQGPLSRIVRGVFCEASSL